MRPENSHSAPELMYIGGEWTPSGSGRVIEIVDPATEEVCGSVPHAEASDVAAAVAAADSAFRVWRKEDAWARSSLLRRMAAYFVENRKEIAWVLTEEQGKPLAEARAEVDAAAEHLDWCADEARRAYGRVIPSNSADVRISVIRQPIGPVAAFTPWNFGDQPTAGHLT